MRQKKTWLLLGALTWASLYAQELIPYRKGDNWGFCTPDKKVVIPPKYDGAGRFHEGLAWVQLNGKYFFIKVFPNGKFIEYYDE